MLCVCDIYYNIPASKRLEALATRLEALADRRRGGGGASADGERESVSMYMSSITTPMNIVIDKHLSLNS